jgi:hypothetical protein
MSRLHGFVGFAGFALCNALLLFSIGCNKPSSPSSATPNDALQDLRAIAAEVKTFDMQGLSGMIGKGMPTAGSLAKKSASGTCVNGVETSDWSDQTLGDSSYSGLDTTRYYDESGNPVCPDNALSYARMHMASHYAGPDESWDMSCSMDNFVIDTSNPPSFAMQLRASQSGSVTRKDGFHFVIETSVFNISCASNDTAASYQMTGSYILSFDEGKYVATLSFVDVNKLFSNDDFGANDLVLRGPIAHGGQAVGYFEVYGDDHVTIRDTNGNDVGH